MERGPSRVGFLCRGTFAKLGTGWGATFGMTPAGKLYYWGLKAALGNG